jgi:hypothetical protein
VPVFVKPEVTVTPPANITICSDLNRTQLVFTVNSTVSGNVTLTDDVPDGVSCTGLPSSGILPVTGKQMMMLWLDGQKHIFCPVEEYSLSRLGYQNSSMA